MLKKYDDITGVEMDLACGFEVVYQTEDGAVFVKHVGYFDALWSDALKSEVFDAAGKVVMVQVRDVAAVTAPTTEARRPRPDFPHVDADGVRTS